MHIMDLCCPRVCLDVRQVFLGTLATLVCAYTKPVTAKASTPVTTSGAECPLVVKVVNGSGTKRSSCGGVVEAGNPQIEWKIIASVIDRVFFILYFVGICFTLGFVFPR